MPFGIVIAICNAGEFEPTHEIHCGIFERQRLDIVLLRSSKGGSETIDASERSLSENFLGFPEILDSELLDDLRVSR